MQHAIVLDLVERIRNEMPRIGTPKLYHLIKDDLTAHKIKMGRTGLNNLLADHGLLIRRKKRRAVTTNSYHRFRKYGNLIKDLVIEEPEQVWVCDISYITITEGFSYLSLVTDAYSKKVVGHCLYPTLEAEGCLIALLMALENRYYPFKTLIHHSDRGIQYCCDEYTSLLKNHKVLISMSTKGDPYENAIAERMNGILKDEFNLERRFTTHSEAEVAITSAITTYNSRRPHASCNFLTPDEAHQTSGTLKKRWKNTYKLREAMNV